MRSGFGYTAVVGGVAAVGLVLAVLSFAGGSSDNTVQEDPHSILAAAAGPVAVLGSHPSTIATTTTTIDAAVLGSDREQFCELAADYVAAYRAAYGVGARPSDSRQDWQKQLELFSLSASLVSPGAVQPESGDTWRTVLLTASDQQAAMNLGLEEVGWTLGAYHNDTPSFGVVAAPTQLIAETCAIEMAR